jgi:hypothetical protein
MRRGWSAIYNCGSRRPCEHSLHQILRQGWGFTGLAEAYQLGMIVRSR